MIINESGYEIRTCESEPDVWFMDFRYVPTYELVQIARQVIDWYDEGE